MIDIPGKERFATAEPISKGWSEDKKYCVTTTGGTQYLLRVGVRHKSFKEMRIDVVFLHILRYIYRRIWRNTYGIETQQHFRGVD